MAENAAHIERINQKPRLWALPDVRELWEYREVMWRLIVRDFKAKYKQSLLGYLWVAITPIITMIVFTFLFKRVTDVPTYDIPYPLFSFAGIVPWTLFSKSFGATATSIVADKAILQKIYYPRLMSPIVKLSAGVIDFLVAMGVLFVLMLIFGYLPPLRALIWIPLFTILTLVTALGFGLFFTALHVRFRDIGYMLPFILQTLMFISPVGYPSELVEGDLAFVYGLNPLVSIIDGFRWALLDIDVFHVSTFSASLISSFVLLLAGLIFFRRLESTFVDLV